MALLRDLYAVPDAPSDGTYGQAPFVNRDFYERGADKMIQNFKDLFKSE